MDEQFSKRMGFKKPKVEIQLTSMDESLKNGIYNLLDTYIFSDYLRLYQYTQGRITHIFFTEFFTNFLNRRRDHLKSYNDPPTFIKEYFDRCTFYEIYDFLEFFVLYDSIFDVDNFIERCNKLFEKEFCGYRFVHKKLVPILNTQEISSIEQAINNSARLNLIGVNAHLDKALAMLSDKKNPDYRNSIKESISAIESICRIITQDKKAELGKALKALKDKIDLHSALESAFSKLYGYTSDSDGIRHALSTDSKLDKEDAVYMLVSCSAFINYLIAKCQKAEIALFI